jgi:hypothetical protein
MLIKVIYVPGNSGRESRRTSAEEVAASFKALALFGLRKPAMHLPQVHLDILCVTNFLIQFMSACPITEAGFKSNLKIIFKAPRLQQK